VSKHTKALDLYARVEDLLGLKEAAPALYAHYLLFLNTLQVDSLLDIGCGSGDFLKQMQNALGISHARGIDLSPLMITKAKQQGVDAELVDVCSLNSDSTYDVITAVFDMLNYLDKESLKRFLICMSGRLKRGGYFVCDINTLFGFQNVAVGSYIIDDQSRFLTVDSDFVEDEYYSEFTLFEKSGNYFEKSQETIRQYYHSIEEIIDYSGLEYFDHTDVNLYGFEEHDKLFIVLKKM